MQEEVYIIDGNRTPFLRSGTGYMDLMSYQLGQEAIKGLLHKTGIDPQLVEQVIMGEVITNIRTTNVARECAVLAGIPSTAPARTITMACISANAAIAQGADLIRLGHADVVVAGGVDNTSDTPISFRKEMRKKLFRAQKIKSMGQGLKFLFSLRIKDFLPERPKVAEFITDRVMGQDCDILAARFEVSREEQDEYAVRSHHFAAKAWEDGHLGKEVTTVAFPPAFKAIEQDNGIRGDSTLEKIARLRPAFDRKFGTLTAANSSFLTDGAAATLLVSGRKLEELGLKPKAKIVDYVFTGQDLHDELLLGPAYAVAKLLGRRGESLEGFDVFEFHEAFAGQIIANIKAISDEKFTRDYLGLDAVLGKPDMDKFNLWGGSLSIGHPFGATGARLVTTAANRLHHENGQRALIASCAAGALGHAMIIERV